MATKASKTSSKRAPRRRVQPARRRSKKKNGQSLSRAILRAEIVGVALVLVAVFTLLSLLTSSRGAVTDSWIGILRGLFGVGVWGIPLVTGALGLWIVIRAIDRMPDLAWQRPTGLILLFLAFVAGASLLFAPDLRARLASEGAAGGQVGLLAADALQGTVGSAGAWVLVSFLGIAGIVFLFDRLLVDAWYSFTDWYGHRKIEGTVAEPPPLSPRVPMPTGRIPWWKRLFPRQPPADPFVPPPGANLVRPEPAAGKSQDAHSQAAQATGDLAPTTPRRSPTQPAESELLNPRIVGGAQDWKLPPLSAILHDWDRTTDSDELIRQQGRLIQETLALFGVPADFEGAYKGPSVTQYLIKPGYVERKTGSETQRTKVKVAKIAGLANDLALALAAPSVRIEAPIPGTNYVGVEVPNQANNVVGLKELMESEAFAEMKGSLRLALGEDVKGQPVVADLARMPHLLIAGATGSGKSVCINSLIADLLLTHTPDSLRFLMIDPKMVELNIYNGVPHLLSPVVTEVDKASAVLYWAVKEMERRYTLFSKANARDLARFNNYLEKNGEKPLPYIVLIVDEMADLMMAAPEEVEKHICRLAQMARAVGMHLIIATQRPSVDVITGLIKANFPARIAFAVTSQTDSRVILDVPGAERLLGRGDMLFMAPDASKLERIQGTFLTDDEINKLVRYWKGIRSYAGNATTDASASGAKTGTTDDGQGELFRSPPALAPTASQPLTQAPLFEQIEQMRSADARDDLFDEAVAIVQEHGRGSVSLLQRKLRIGYGRAARLVDQLEAAGILGPDQGASRGRDFLTPRQENSPAASIPGNTKVTGKNDDEDAGRPQIWM